MNIMGNKNQRTRADREQQISSAAMCAHISLRHCVVKYAKRNIDADEIKQATHVSMFANREWKKGIILMITIIGSKHLYTRVLSSRFEMSSSKLKIPIAQWIRLELLIVTNRLSLLPFRQGDGSAGGRRSSLEVG